MTNLQKAAEQGSQAAPNILDAIKAGEAGGGIKEVYELTLYSITSEEDFTAIVNTAKQIPNIVIIAYSSSESEEENRVSFGYYTNYASIKDNIRLYYELVGAYYSEAEALIDLIELDTIVLTTNSELVESLFIGSIINTKMFTLGHLLVGDGAPTILHFDEQDFAGPAILAPSPNVVVYIVS